MDINFSASSSSYLPAPFWYFRTKKWRLVCFRTPSEIKTKPRPHKPCAGTVITPASS